MCVFVKDLLDRAIQLDIIRQIQYINENTSENTTSLKASITKETMVTTFLVLTHQFTRKKIKVIADASK